MCNVWAGVEKLGPGAISNKIRYDQLGLVWDLSGTSLGFPRWLGGQLGLVWDMCGASPQANKFKFDALDFGCWLIPKMIS